MAEISALDLFRREEPGDGARWRVVRAGALDVQSGRVLACDPLVGGGEAFARAVAPGLYPVEIAVAARDGDERVGAARLVLGAGEPVRWEMAVRPGERLEVLRAGQGFGYGVDSGTGCFADASEADAMPADALSDELARRYRSTWSHAAYPSAKQASVVAFSTGYGDGVYASYWGFDAGGALVCLVTDFGVADVAWPALEDHIEARRAYAAELMARLRATRDYDGTEAVLELGALGGEARGFAGELLGMLREGLREDQHAAIARALQQIALEAPEVADLAADLWSPGDPHAAALLAIVRRPRALSSRTRALLVAIARDPRLEDDDRVSSMQRLATELPPREALALLDGLARDRAPALRAEALRLLRDVEPVEAWAVRVERFVGDASAHVRRELARELGAILNEVDRWVGVLGPMRADVDEGVQLAAAIALSSSARNWPLAVEVFERVLEGELVEDGSGDSAHSHVLWALSSGAVPNEVARTLIAPHRARLGGHPAIDAVFKGAKKASGAKKGAEKGAEKGAKKGAKQGPEKAPKKPRAPGAKKGAKRSPKKVPSKSAARAPIKPSAKRASRAAGAKARRRKPT